MLGENKSRGSGSLSRAEGIALGSVLLVSFVLNVYQIWWGMPSNRGWAPDEILPHQMRQGMSQWFSFGWHYTYPAVHYYILSILYYPFLWLHEHHRLWGDLTSLLFIVGRSVSLLMSIGSLYFIFLIGRYLFDGWTGIFAALLTALTPQFVYYSKVVNLDIPMLFWFLLSMLFFFRALKEQRVQDYVLLAIAASLAVCTKDQAIGMYLPLPFLLAIADYRKEKALTGYAPTLIRIIFSYKMRLAALISLLLFVILHNWIFNFEGFLGHLQIILGDESRERYYLFDTSLAGKLGLLKQSLWNINFCFGAPALVLCFVGILVDLKSRGRNSSFWVILPSLITFYIFIISPIRYSVDRYFIPYVALISPYGGMMLRKFGTKGVPIKLFGSIAAGLILGFSAARAMSVNSLMKYDSRYLAESWLQAHVPAGDTVYTTGRLYYLPRLEHYRAKAAIPRLASLDYIKNHYLIISANDLYRYKRGSLAYGFYERLLSGKTRCSESFRYKATPPLNIIEPKWSNTNLIKINPEIHIYFCPDRA